MRKFSFDISVAALDDCSYDSVALSYKLLLFFFSFGTGKNSISSPDP